MSPFPLTLRSPHTLLAAGLATAAGIAVACVRRRASARPFATALCQRDPTSQSNIGQVRITSLHLDLVPDFPSRTIQGSAFVTFTRVSTAGAPTQEIVLDTRGLSLSSVTFLDVGCPLEFVLDAPHPKFGQALRIMIPQEHQRCETFRILIHYTTSPDAGATQWLTPEQTASKKHPYLFTQCQAIHARSLVPIQDTPAVKFPFTAKVVVPAPLVALMSAKQLHSCPVGKTHLAYTFNQPIPVPSYLIALAVGELEARSIGPRSRVWSEPSMVEACAFEFAKTESYVAEAEKLLGKYEWGHYDLLVLPPSMAYGGMEHPTLSFLTPTLLTGDPSRPLADTVIHECVHSWTGNLVTSETWEDFWLNEGFTMFCERKILSRLRGEPERHLSAVQGWFALTDEVVTHRGVDHEFTRLVPFLEGVDPDDAFGTVPYEKGHSFLMYIESLVGVEAMDAFLKDYIQEFKFQSINTKTWKAFLLNYFRNNPKVAAIDFDAWFHSTGMPIVTPKFDTSLSSACESLASRWLSGGSGFTNDDIKKWSTRQIIVFLNIFLSPENKPLTPERLAKMDKFYKISKSNISEIQYRWYRMGIQSGYEPVLAPTVEFLGKVGRMKFVRPLYRELFLKSPQTKKLALETFAKNRSSYHPIAAKMVAQDLGV